jgi:hypothetical protein
MATKLHNNTFQKTTFCKCTTFERSYHNVTEVSGENSGLGVRRTLQGSCKLFAPKMEVKRNRKQSNFIFTIWWAIKRQEESSVHDRNMNAVQNFSLKKLTEVITWKSRE